ncbi:MAG: TetR/AcrR family transcriptional regulator [Syntrophobacteraceae bacterium]
MGQQKLKTKRASVEDLNRKRIVAAARRIFFAGGFRSVTMDQLARELGMSKKTVYEHFPGKTSLVQEAIFDKLQDVDRELGQIACGGSTDFAAILQLMFGCIQRHADEIQSPFLRDIRLHPELFSDLELRRGELARRYFERIIREGRKAAIIREDIPEGVIIEIMLAALERIMNPSKLSELDLTPRAAISAILALIMRGIRIDNQKAQ